MVDHILRVLFVDDEPDLLLIAGAYLKSHNIQIDTAISGQEALCKFESTPYDAIVSDYEMPGMDGLSLLKEIRKRNPEIPFILFTGRGREEVVIQAIENGADYYVQKGIDFVSQFTELIHKIKRAVERQKSNQIHKEIEDGFRLAFDCASDAIFWADAETGILINCNTAAEQLIERKRDEIIGKHHSILHPPTLYNESDALFQNQVQNPRYSADELNVLTKSGTLVPVRIFNTVTYIGNKKIIQGIFYNISQEIQKQNALEVSESRFKTLFDSITIPTWEIDFSDIKQYFNDLRSSKITNIREYLHQYPEKIRYCMSLMKIIHVNAATLELFQVHTKEEAIQCMISLFTDDSWPIFGEQLIALDEGKTLFEATSPVCDPHGKIKNLFLRVTVDKEDIQTLSRVYVSYQNIS